MKLSLNWLKDYIDIEMPPDELASILTMAGLEVEGIEQAGHSLDDIVAARVLEVSSHPVSDRLYVCQIDAGTDTFQVVCGAPNIQVDSLVPFAPDRAKLPNGTVIKKGKFKGVLSKGVLLAEDELGLTDDHSGLMMLPHTLAPGTPLSSLGDGPDSLALSDWVFDLSITPNRPDWASVLGVAKEIAAITRQKIRRPGVDFQEGDTPIEALTSVTILDPDGCPRYAAGVVQDVQLGPSPFWMRYRLFLSGIRSISNIVDVTNYVLLEFGQPLHAFDFERLKENRIEVRRAMKGETFTTLDGETRALSTENLMICDAERAVALAGIMGGLNSEIFEQTTDILLESAFFDPVTIRRGSKGLGLSTEASYRFERGADIEGIPTALNRAMSLISQLAGGKVAKGIIDQYPKPYISPNISLRVEKANRILGTDISKDIMADHLRALEMDVHDIDENEIKVTPPSFRVDISREIDLIEEVARLHGYGNIPITYPSIGAMQSVDSPELGLRDRIRASMVGLGFTEIITYSFISPDSADILGAEEESPLRSFVQILNPLSVDQSVMRTSLIPGILGTIKNNIAYDEKDIKLFEWGKVFRSSDQDTLPHEKIYLAGAMSGLVEQKTWYGPARTTDFFDVKGALEALLEDLGLEDIAFRQKTDLTAYDPASTAGVFIGGSVVGWLGRASESVMEAYDLNKEDVYLFEMDITAILENVPETVTFRPFAKFPAVYRDISLLVDREIERDTIIGIAKQAGDEWLESIEIYDIYEGGNLDPSKKAMTFRLCYRSKGGTLDGGKVSQLHDSIIGQIRRETGGTLREG